MESRRQFLAKSGGALAGLAFADQAEAQGVPLFSRDILNEVTAANKKLPITDQIWLPLILPVPSALIKVPTDVIETTIKNAVVNRKANPNALIPIPAYTLDFQKQVVEHEPLLNLCVTRHKLYPLLRTKYLKIAEALIANGANVNLQSQPHRNDSPVTHAARTNQTEMVTLLLKHKANPNAKDAEGNTALHYAYGFKNQTIIDSLIKAGADQSIKNKKGLSPKDMGKSKLDPRLLADNINEMLLPEFKSKEIQV